MMNKIFIAAILLALTLISGCDNRKKLTSTSIPFSIGGIALGIGCGIGSAALVKLICKKIDKHKELKAEQKEQIQ